MNTEQLKTDRTKEEILESLLSLNSHIPVHGNEVILFNQTKQRALEAMQIFASQESKRAVDVFKEKLKDEARQRGFSEEDYNGKILFDLIDKL